MRSRYEIKCQKQLEAEGYIVDYKTRPSFYAVNVDYFNLFDIVAVKKGKPVRWISIKGHAGVPPKHREAIKKFPLPKQGNSKEIWHWPKRKKKKEDWIKEIY